VIIKEPIMRHHTWTDFRPHHQHCKQCWMLATWYAS